MQDIFTCFCNWNWTRVKNLLCNTVLDMKMCIYWSKSKFWIYFYIVLNKNWKIHWSKVLLVFGQRTSAHREDWTMLKCMYVLCTNNLFCMINATSSFSEIYTSMFDWMTVCFRGAGISEKLPEFFTPAIFFHFLLPP